MRLRIGFSWTLFPARVGVFPRERIRGRPGGTVPRAHGGISPYPELHPMRPVCSPRAWGYFLGRLRDHQRQPLFPARMGVFPLSKSCVSLQHRCSPRAWGYFRSVSRVFRSSIAVPRAHGGISASAGGRVKVNRCSPRAWGYFPPAPPVGEAGSLFPARMGVFPYANRPAHSRSPVPRAHGGISPECLANRIFRPCSPRAWGYFRQASSPAFTAMLFPARMGVIVKRKLKLHA